MQQPPERHEPPRGVVDPLAEARWEQVRGDEDGIRSEWSGEPREETSTDLSGEDPAGDRDDAEGGITGGMGDPGGER